MKEKIGIREMAESDYTVIANAFATQGWNKPASQYLRYWQEHKEGKRDNLLAEYDGQFAGYVTVVWESDYPPFLQVGIPEIRDFNVLIKYRRLRIGTALMDAAEKCVTRQALIVGLGVCLEADYGAAQVLYARRGYVPDGRGVFYQGRYPTHGEYVQLGDDLCLYLTKRLRPE
jgi:GNAT superfamily N-acetyltransferase